MNFLNKRGPLSEPFHRARDPLAALVRRMGLAASLVALLPLVGLCGPSSSALHSKADLFVRQSHDKNPQTGWASLIVQLDGKLTPERAQLLKALGGYVYRDLSIIQSVAVKVPNRNVAKLASYGWVKRLSSDVAVQKNDLFTTGRSGAWMANLFSYTGKGVTVAVVDSGIASVHEDLMNADKTASRVVGGATFLGTNTTGNPLKDLSGHGTHIAGILGGNGACSSDQWFFQTVRGIAPEVNLVSVRVLNKYGEGSVSDTIAGIQWTIANKATHNIRVINLSLGHDVGESYTTDPLCQAVKQAWDAGIVVVCAAGNNGRCSATQVPGLDNECYGTNYGSIQSPANSPYVITVGAMKQTAGREWDRNSDQIATYSGRGPTRLDYVLKPDLVAPGNQVKSLNVPGSVLSVSYGITNAISWSELSTHGADYYGDAAYFKLSGTSMAAPVVSGAVALLLQKDPTLTPSTVKARLMLTADKWAFPNGTTDALTFGAGYLNIPAALSNTVVAKGPAVSPPLAKDSSYNVLIDGSKAIWGNDGIWGIGIGDLKAIWGVNAIWGLNTLSSSKAVWGNIIWGDKAIWGTSMSRVDLSKTVISGE